MTDIPLAVWLALFSVVAVPTVAWSFKIVREDNRVVTLDGKRLDTIAAQGEYIAALEQKCKALQSIIDTREAEYSEKLRRADARIASLQGDIDDLKTIVKQWRIVQDVQDVRAASHEAREVHEAARVDAADKRQQARATRSEGREVRQEAREVAQEARATGETA